MAELLSAGVFIEEVPTAVQVVQPVSTSNMGIAGGSQRGPTNEATLITSFEQYTRVFGSLIAESRAGLSMAAYFANGGRRSFFVRVMPGDAVVADGWITSARKDFQTNIGDGAAATVTQLVLTPTLLDLPVMSVDGVAGVGFRWRSNGTPVVLQSMRNRADSAVVALVNGTASYEARILASALPTDLDIALPCVMPGETITLTWNPDGVGDITMTLTQFGTDFVATGTTAEGSIGVLDLVRGFLSVIFDGTDVPVVGCLGNLRLDYTPGTAIRSISDNGSGVIVDDGSGTLTGAGAITYLTGAYTFTTTVPCTVGTACPVVADCAVQAWELNPVSVGSWANTMKVEVQGNPDYYTVATDTYSRFNVNILLLNSSTGLYDIMETHEELTFTDPTSPKYFPDVLNDLSDFVDVVDPALHAEAPSSLAGWARSVVVAAGDAAVGNRAIKTTLPHSVIVPRTFRLTYLDVGAVTRTITDDGAGNLIGDVDGAGVNAITYTSGAIDLLVATAIDSGQLVLATYRSESVENFHRDVFVDGANGTFTNPAEYGRSQFTAPGLMASYQGIYALSRIEELMQVVLPDFAGDTQISKDLLDYVAGRQSLPAGGDRFAILMVPQGYTAQEAVNWIRFDMAQYTKYAAFYWPWVKIADPLADNRPLVFPPLGHIAGIYARTDATRNVAKSPAGTIDGALRFLIGLESPNDQATRDIVYPARINPLISGSQTGLAVWGSRTASLDSSWRYINVERLFMFVERSVFNSTFWICFENNGSGLWSRIKAQIQSFLNGLFTDAMLAGTTPAEAFYVIVDETNNDQASIDAGQVIVDIGIAPLKPAEFVRFRLAQKTLST